MAALSKYVTISVKVPATLRDELQKLGVKPSKILRKARPARLRWPRTAVWRNG
jgi:hypothetical protein